MQLVRIARGKRLVIAIGDRKKLQDRMKQLKKSTMRGVCGQQGKKYKVEYLIEEEPTTKGADNGHENDQDL